jgi:hypothetical protein
MIAIAHRSLWKGIEMHTLGFFTAKQIPAVPHRAAPDQRNL